MVTLALLAALFLPQEPPPAKKAKPEAKVHSARPDKAQVKVGEPFKVSFDVEMTPGWHIYPTTGTTTGEPTRFTIEGAETAGKIEEPKPKVHPAEEGQPAYEYHEGRITITVPLFLKPGPKPGPLELKGKMRYILCDPNSCLPPKDALFAFPLTVLEGAMTPPPVTPQKSAAGEAAREFEEKGLGWLLGISILGGLISLVMPCVYPLIPITITYFVKQAGASRATGMLLSSVYGLGIVVTFTGLGFLLTILLGAQGAQIFASNPWVNLAVATLFMVFALSLLGLFEIRLPQALTGRLVGGQRSGMGGAFVLGLLFSVISFTCTIPIAATILGVAASGEHRLAGLLAMLVYSGTMAVPFLLLGIFPSLVKELPKSGGWLHTVKVTAGFFEVALAAAYIWKADLVWNWGIFDRGLVLAVWIAMAFAIAIYLLGFFRLKEDEEKPTVSFGRLGTALFFGIMGFFLLGGVFGRPVGVFNVVLPPEEKAAVAGEGGLKAYADLESAEQAARKENKPVFAEFTGYT